MKISHLSLVCVPLLALTACAGVETTTTGPPAAVYAAPTSPSAAATTAGATTTGSADDKKLCESANKIGEEMKTALFTALQSSKGKPTAATYKKILTEFTKKVNEATAKAGASAVTTATKEISAEAAKAAASADPETAASSGAFEKAGTNLTAACKAAGTPVNY